MSAEGICRNGINSTTDLSGVVYAGRRQLLDEDLGGQERLESALAAPSEIEITGCVLGG